MLKIPVSPAALGAGLVVVAAGIGIAFYIQRDEFIELRGSILKVRTQAMDEASAVVIIDFRFANPSIHPFVVKQVDVLLEDKDGKALEGKFVPESDAQRLFQYYPVLGQKFNDTLRTRDKVPSRSTWDRMVASRFEVPDASLQSRRKLTVRITEVDGAVSEVVEAGAPR
ncbi:MAG: hypothetical protein ACRD8O_07140 [Bryobacteraceae bacterium]